MATTIEAASVLTGVNVLFLLALTGVWIRNYALFKSRLVLGLLAFAVVMLAENAVALYFFLTMKGFYGMTPRVQQAVLVLRTLEFVALAFLTYVTMK
ncbi:hypothetical protein [Haladaptatus halobius]|jgi:hypothetical protein|uniref:hypothetical protein n=1 Tax=Haladaptatus halobius TaxID=2884875 RepID=UPI001D0A0D82|nr:hypothetical protein [Haladaptatus halobius]